MTLAIDAPRGWNRPLLALTAATIVLALVAVVGIFADPVLVTGVRAWIKPFKFAVSFVLYSFTLAWLLAQLPRRSRIAEWAGLVIVAVAVAELAIIVVQAARGRASHFNDTTSSDAALFAAMGASIMVLFVAHLVIGIVALRQRLGDRAATYAVRLGLALALLGMLAAVPMVTPMQDPGIAGISGAHSVGVPDGGPGMPLTGWSTIGGDLRIGHFVGLHGLQALPLLAFLLGRLPRRFDEATRARLVLTGGIAYGLLTVILTWQALRAQPLLHPDMLTSVAFAALIAATAAATTLILKNGAHS